MSLLCHPPLFNFHLLEELIVRTAEYDDLNNIKNDDNETVSENYEYSKNTEIVSNSNDLNNSKNKNNDKNKDDNVEKPKSNEENKLNKVDLNSHQPISTSSLPRPLSLPSPIPVPRVPNDDSDCFRDCRHFLALTRPGNYFTFRSLFSFIFIVYVFFFVNHPLFISLDILVLYFLFFFLLNFSNSFLACLLACLYLFP